MWRTSRLPPNIRPREFYTVSPQSLNITVTDAYLRTASLGAFSITVGSGSFSPADIISSIPFWFDVSDAANVGFSGAALTSVTNKGNAGGTVTPSSGTVSRISAVQGGKDIARFAGSNALTTSGTVTLNPTSNLSVWAVVKNTSSTAIYGSLLECGNSPSTGVQITTAGGTTSDWVTNDLAASGHGYAASFVPRAIAHPSPISVPDTVFHVIRVDLGATLADVYSNGAAATLTSTTTAAWTSITAALLLGNGWIGDIGEWIVGYDLSSTNRTNIDNYLLAKWGLP